MYKLVEAKAKTCESCRKHKKSKPRQQPFVSIELQAFEPGECWSVDIMSIGMLDYLVCVDRVSQYMMLAKLPNKTGKACTLSKHGLRTLAFQHYFGQTVAQHLIAT